MFRFILFGLPIITLLVPRRFFRRYVQLMSVSALVLVILVALSGEKGGEHDELYALFIVIAFIFMNGVVMAIKSLALRKTKPSLRVPMDKPANDNE